jgi:hypothetical protein
VNKLYRFPRHIFLSFSLLLLSMIVFSDPSSAQLNVVAKYTVQVGAPPGATKETTLPPGVEIVGGKKAITLGPLEKGMKERAVAVSVGTYIFLRFPASLGKVRYIVEPSRGVLEPPPGRYHMPKDVVGMVQATNEGQATITVHSVTTAKINAGGNPSGGTSPNWSGYGQVGGPFTNIVGAWTVPAVGSDAGSDSSSWVGIDGFGNSSLIQVGTEQDYSTGNWFGIGDGPHYYAWWEILPAAETAISNPVSPGDKMIAIITPVGTATANTASNWTITLINETQHWSFSTTQSYSGPLTSAEWIEEAPSLSNGTILPLADYGSVTFDVYDWLAGGASPNFTAFQSINMTASAGNIISSPSNPDGDADGFTVAFGSIPPPPPGPFVTTTHLHDGVLHQFYQQTLVSSGPAVTDWSWNGSTPPGLSLDWSTGTISGTPTVTGTFSFTVSALEADIAGVATQKQPLTLQVLATPPPPPPPDFRLLASPRIVQWITTTGGCSASENILVNPLNGFTGTVSLSASRLPSGMTASFSPATTQHTSVLQLSSSPCILDTMAVGRIFIMITGTSGSLSRSTTIEIISFSPEPHCNKPGGCPQS